MAQCNKKLNTYTKNRLHFMQDVGDFCIVSDCVLEKCARRQTIKKCDGYVLLKLSGFWEACCHILMCISNFFKMCIDSRCLTT